VISIVLPVHNKQDLINKVLIGMWNNTSDLLKELIIVLDGCTDASEDIVTKFCLNNDPAGTVTKILHTPNVFEVRACNVGLKAATQPFVVSIQDDMVVNELGWDVRLIKPFLVWNDVFAVTALAAVNLGIENDHMMWYDAVNYHNSPRNKFVIRDVVNRGPLMFRKSMLEELGYLDEIYAPMSMDDMDVCMRAWQHGWVSGCYPMPAMFKIEDGTSRQNAKSADVCSKSWQKNEKILIERHREAIIGKKHSEDRELP
jgi:GT2 family glycosyltransferase